MIKQYAILNNNVVVDIKYFEESDLVDLSRVYQMIIDINDMSNKPSIGWVLQGNKLVSNDNFASIQDQVYDQQQRQRIFGQYLSPILVDMMGARNLQLALEGTSVNVSALLNSLNAVKALMETGALKTARTVIGSVSPSFPAYADIFTYAVNEITTFLAQNKYE